VQLQLLPPERPLVRVCLSAVNAYVLREFARDLRIAEGTEPANDEQAENDVTRGNTFSRPTRPHRPMP
jgi:hypothetical protein